MNDEASGNGSARQASPVLTPETNRCDLRILNAIRQIIRAADVDSHNLAASHDITTPQLMCLMAVAERSPCTAVDIARRVHVSTSTLVGVLDRLEAKRLIMRERSKTDRREVQIAPTDAGRKLVSSTPFPLQYSLGKAMKQLSPSERDEMAAAVERLVELMGADEVDASPMLEISSVSARQK